MPYNFKKLLKKDNFSGHVNYSCPELILEEDNFTPKVDIWSLGCVLYYLATKKDPFTCKEPKQIKQRILNSDVHLHEEEGLEPIVSDLIKACLVRDPEQRPSASQLLELLDKTEVDYFGKVVSDFEGFNVKNSSKLKVGRTFKPFTPSTSNFDPPSYLDQNDEESMDMSFLNKVFAPEDVSKNSDIWSSPDSNKDSDKQSTTGKLTLHEVIPPMNCKVEFKGEMKDGKLVGFSTISFENGDSYTGDVTDNVNIPDG